MFRTAAFAAAFACASLSGLAGAGAQTMPMDHTQHMMPGMAGAGGDDGPSSQAFEAANAKMHKDMALPMTGNADLDFARGMIPHHQGAIDMAKVELTYGKDPELRRLAEDIIKAQEAEIAFLKTWIADHAK
ncbi:CopM family metallochaperone [Ancylobacter lacus]|uniref:CopM family metallochaperone n=1 Tax=Ancylobacter lacus TaxID=2579970 RepID=UPI001BCD4B42|nr:DUF305 domain-containing protein [Ancylobacter lacus]MBS7537465.1 DUF305 domain-containing protein [Ancylobacter lacus]